MKCAQISMISRYVYEDHNVIKNSYLLNVLDRNSSIFLFEISSSLAQIFFLTGIHTLISTDECMYVCECACGARVFFLDQKVKKKFYKKWEYVKKIKDIFYFLFPSQFRKVGEQILLCSQ